MDLSIVVVGDEILAGHVQDANAHFIATRAADLGHRLRRVVVVSDEPQQIAEEIARALDGASLVFVCGGIGPTHDDRTMEGVATALGRTLVRSPVLSGWIGMLIERIESEGFSGGVWGFDSLRKMELVPEGAEVVTSNRMLIPLVIAPAGDARVVVLPGPPRELQGLFTEIIEPKFLAGTGAQLVREEISHPFFESTIAAMLGDLQDRYPSTSIGSYPQTDHTLVRIAGPADDARAAAELLRAHLDQLTDSEEGKRLLGFVEQRRVRRDSAETT